MWMLDWEFTTYGGVAYYFEVGAMNLAGASYQARILPDMPIAELQKVLAGPENTQMQRNMFHKFFDT